MSRPQNGWGEPSYSQDIADNYYKTHHEDEDNQGSFIANDQDYLNGLYDDDSIPSDGVVHMSYHYLNDEFHNMSSDDNDDFPKDEDGFYIIPDDDFIDSNNYSYADTDDFRDRFDFDNGVIDDLDDLDDDDYDDSMW